MLTLPARHLSFATLHLPCPTLPLSNNAPSPSWTACADEAALRAWHTRYFGKQGEVLQALEAVGEMPPAERKAYGQAANRIKETLTAGLRSRAGRRKGTRPGAQPDGRGARRDPAGPAGAARPAARRHADPARHLRHLRRPGLSDLPQPRSRGRRDQLRAAQHAAAPPGPRHVGHLPHHHARRAAAHAHLAGPDPRHAAATVPSRSASSCRACATATRPSPRAARSCSTRSRAWSSAST